MQFLYALITAIVWSIVSALEHTSLFSDPFPFHPIRSVFVAAIGVSAIVIATLHYTWQLWFARISAALIALFLLASVWLDLMPVGNLKNPTYIAFALWCIFALVASYQKKV